MAFGLGPRSGSGKAQGKPLTGLSLVASELDQGEDRSTPMGGAVRPATRRPKDVVVAAAAAADEEKEDEDAGIDNGGRTGRVVDEDDDDVVVVAKVEPLVDSPGKPRSRWRPATSDVCEALALA